MKVDSSRSLRGMATERYHDARRSLISAAQGRDMSQVSPEVAEAVMGGSWDQVLFTV